MSSKRWTRKQINPTYFLVVLRSRWTFGLPSVNTVCLPLRKPTSLRCLLSRHLIRICPKGARKSLFRLISRRSSRTLINLPKLGSMCTTIRFQHKALMSFAHVPAFKVVIVSKFVLLVSDVEIRLASLIIFRGKHGGTRFANISGIFMRLFLFVCFSCRARSIGGLSQSEASWHFRKMLLTGVRLAVTVSQSVSQSVI